MGVKIKDIAKRLGVSPGTISKALNDKKGVSEELKKKIKKLANEMGYRPNLIAQRLSSKKSNTIGVFILSRDKIKLRDSFAIEILDGITEKANKLGYDILLFTTTGNNLNEEQYIELCKARRVEGAIFIGLCSDDPQLEDIRASDIPIAIIDLELDAKNVGYISSDNELGIISALEYLINLGHRKIGFIGSSKTAEVSQIRYKAYQSYLKARNLYKADYVWEGDFTRESGEKVAEEVLRLKDRPTAIISASDSMALGAIKIFKDKGIRIPEDISVIGFDNISATEYSNPRLTTINQDGIALGKEALNFILNKSQGNSVPKRRLLKPELIIRDSVKDIRNNF
ncbi:LacI family DNA-binding transcriptional regulator [Orenia marismortui]|uniref:LacI family transcriptional regulator n=1 Tax=Orenia marismortui TaxID=46469 RepID=A0A4R8GIL7_9FIRM|nr:LacI family DNA-binding transcriptional regulator [Orenia marismortui]TDX45530.1 LacI family transcriptional regulator [Orenia marismortui]